MNGSEVIRRCKAGDRIELSSRCGRIHTLYADKSTGELRICRPTMLSSTDDRDSKPSDWIKFEGSEMEYQARKCKEC